MADTTHLVVAVEGTATMSRYWGTVLSDYLEPMIRSFCGIEETSSEEDDSNVELGILIFHARGFFSPCLIRQTEWITDMDIFFDWLSALTFSGGEFCDVAIAEALAEVIAIIPSPIGHCILVAANNPNPLPTPVYPASDMSEVDFQSRLADAQTVATSFPECSVSLSVICPMTLPKLKTIYNTGKRNPSAADYTIDIVKNPRYLVLISEDFVDSCADLSLSRITKMEVASVSAVSETTSASPVNQSPESTKVDRISVSSPASGLTVEHIPPVSCATSQEVSSLQTLAPSHEIISRNDATETRRLMPPPPPRTSREEVQSHSSHSTFLKIWEGDLFGGLGNRHFVSRLEGYQISTSSDLLAEDWPKTMLIDMLIPKDFMTNNPHADKAESLVFRSMDQTDTLINYQKRKLCMLIQLPSQTLVMAVTERPCGLIAKLYPKDKVVFEPKMSEQKESPSQQQQQQGQVSPSGPKA